MRCTFYRGSGTLAQECIYTSGADPKRWLRYQDGEGNWGAWKRVYDDTILNDSTILSPLASALGGVKGMGRLDGTGKGVDDVVVTSIYSCSMVNGAPEHYGMLVTLMIGGNGYTGLQFFYATTGHLYIRYTLNSSSFAGMQWYKFDGTIVTQ